MQLLISKAIYRRQNEPGALDLLLQRWLITGSQYHDGIHELWLQHGIENEECKHKELKFKLPPPALTIIPPQPSLHPVTPSPAPSLPINHNNNNPAKTTTPACPPPWSIIPTLIIPTANSHPPPWPNCHHHHHHNTNHPIISTPPARPPPWPILSPNTLRNHWNARC